MAGILGHAEKMVTEFHNFVSDPVNNPFLLSVAVVLLSSFVILVLFAINSRKGRRQGILLLGLCDSGKTLLYSLLTQKRMVLTHTSIRENQGKYEIKQSKKATHAVIVDLPGNERIRSKYIKKYEDMARGIIFMVDSAAFPKQIRDIAEYLYDVFSNKILMSSKPSVLVVCNKQDIPTAKSANVIKSQLEKEIHEMRFTRAAALKGTDDMNSKRDVDVGKKGKVFEFGQLQGKINFIECSIGTEDSVGVGIICEWIEKAFM